MIKKKARVSRAVSKVKKLSIPTTPAQKRAAATSLKYNVNPNATYGAAIKNAKVGNLGGSVAKALRLTSTATPKQSRMLNERGRTALRLERAATRQSKKK